MEIKPMTVGQLKVIIKDISDETPIYMDDEHEIMMILSTRQDSVAVWNEDNDDDVFVEALILGVA